MWPKKTPSCKKKHYHELEKGVGGVLENKGKLPQKRYFCNSFKFFLEKKVIVSLSNKGLINLGEVSPDLLSCWFLN